MSGAAAVIPAHDEAGTVGPVVREALRHVACVLVVDDGSRDDTSAVAREAGAMVLRLDPNRGKGEALVRGLDEAVRLGFDRVVTLDADGEHDASQIPDLLAALDHADVALGARAVYRSGARAFVNALALFWFRVLDRSIDDTICGFRAFRVSALPAVQNRAGGFVYEHEVILRAVAAGLRLRSVPVRTTPRAGSHVTAREMIRANNHFDRWVLAALPTLPLPLWRRALLFVGCVSGLALGVPAAWALGLRERRA